MSRPPPRFPLFPYTTLFRSALARDGFGALDHVGIQGGLDLDFTFWRVRAGVGLGAGGRSTQQRHTGSELSTRSEEHTSELQSPCNLVCRLLLEKKNKKRCSR